MAWVYGVAQQRPGAPARRAARPGARRRHVMDVERFLPGRTGFDHFTFHCEKGGKKTATVKYPG
jgi:hypothetical protein